MALSSITNVLLYLTADSSKAQVELNKTFKGIERHSDNLNTKLGKLKDKQDLIVSSSNEVRKALEQVANVKIGKIADDLHSTSNELYAQRDAVKQLKNEYRALKDVADITLKDDRGYKDRKQSITDLTATLDEHNRKLAEQKAKLELAKMGTYDLTASERSKQTLYQSLITQEQSLTKTVEEKNKAQIEARRIADELKSKEAEITAEQLNNALSIKKKKEEIDKLNNSIKENNQLSEQQKEKEISLTNAMNKLIEKEKQLQAELLKRKASKDDFLKQDRQLTVQEQQYDLSIKGIEKSLQRKQNALLKVNSETNSLSNNLKTLMTGSKDYENALKKLNEFIDQPKYMLAFQKEALSRFKVGSPEHEDWNRIRGELSKQLRSEGIYLQDFEKEFRRVNSLIKLYESNLLTAEIKQKAFNEEIKKIKGDKTKELTDDITLLTEKLNKAKQAKAEFNQTSLDKLNNDIKKQEELIKKVSDKYQELGDKTGRFYKNLNQKQTEQLANDKKALENAELSLKALEQRKLEIEKKAPAKAEKDAQKALEDYNRLNDRLQTVRNNLTGVKYELDAIPINKIDKAQKEFDNVSKKIQKTESNLEQAKQKLQEYVDLKIDKKSKEFEDAQKKVKGLESSLDSLRNKGKEIEKQSELNAQREKTRTDQKIAQIKTQSQAMDKHLKDLEARKVDLIDANDQRNKINIVSGALFALSTVFYTLTGYVRQFGQEVNKAFEGFKNLDSDILQLRALEQVSGNIDDLIAGKRTEITPYGTLIKEMIELGDAYGLSADEVGKAHKKIVQTGLEGRDAVELFKAAQYSAIATQADFNKIVDAGLKIHFNYGVAIKDLPTYFNLMAVTAARSSIAMEDFSARIGELSAVAAPLKIDFGELITLYGSMAKRLKDPAQASVSLVNYLTKLQKPYGETKEVIKKLNEAFKLTGKAQIQFSEEGIRNAGGILKFTEKLKGMIDQVSNGSEVVNKLFPEIRSMRGFQALGKDVAELGKELDFASNQTEFLHNSFKEMTQSLEFRFKSVKTQIQNMFIKIFANNRKQIQNFFEMMVNGLNWFIRVVYDNLPQIKAMFEGLVAIFKNLSFLIDNLSSEFNVFKGSLAVVEIGVITLTNGLSTLVGVFRALWELVFNFSTDGFNRELDKITQNAVKSHKAIDSIRNNSLPWLGNGEKESENNDLKITQIEEATQKAIELQKAMKSIAPKGSEIATPEQLKSLSIMNAQLERQKTIIEKLRGTRKDSHVPQIETAKPEIPTIDKYKKTTPPARPKGLPTIDLDGDKSGNKAYNKAKSDLDKLIQVIEDFYSKRKESANEMYNMAQISEKELSDKIIQIEKERASNYINLEKGRFENITVFNDKAYKHSLKTFLAQKGLIKTALKEEINKTSEIEKRQEDSTNNISNEIKKQNRIRQAEEFKTLQDSINKNKQGLEDRIKLELLTDSQSTELRKQSFEKEINDLKNFQAKKKAEGIGYTRELENKIEEEIKKAQESKNSLIVELDAKKNQTLVNYQNDLNKNIISSEFTTLSEKKKALGEQLKYLDMWSNEAYQIMNDYNNSLIQLELKRLSVSQDVNNKVRDYIQSTYSELTTSIGGQGDKLSSLTNPLLDFYKQSSDLQNKGSLIAKKYNEVQGELFSKSPKTKDQMILLGKSLNDLGNQLKQADFEAGQLIEKSKWDIFFTVVSEGTKAWIENLKGMGQAIQEYGIQNLYDLGATVENFVMNTAGWLLKAVGLWKDKKLFGELIKDAEDSFSKLDQMLTKNNKTQVEDIKDIKDLKEETKKWEIEQIDSVYKEELKRHNERVKQIKRERDDEISAIQEVQNLKDKRRLEQLKKSGANQQFIQELQQVNLSEGFFRKTDEEFENWLESEKDKIETAFNITGDISKEEFMKRNRELSIQASAYLKRRLEGTADEPERAKLLQDQLNLEQQRLKIESLLQTAKLQKDSSKQKELENDLELLSTSILNLKNLKDGTKTLKAKTEITKKLQGMQSLFLENAYDLEMEQAEAEEEQHRKKVENLDQQLSIEESNIESLARTRDKFLEKVENDYEKEGNYWLDTMKSRMGEFVNFASVQFSQLYNKADQIRFGNLKDYFRGEVDAINSVLDRLHSINQEVLPKTQSVSQSYATSTPVSQDDNLLSLAKQHPKWNSDRVGALLESGASYQDAIRLAGGVDTYKQGSMGSITKSPDNPFYVPDTYQPTEVDKWIEQANKIALGQFAGGGVIDRPTIALMGENGAETVFNASQMRNLHNIISSGRGLGSTSNSTSVNIVFSGQINASNQGDVNTLAEKVSKVITKQLARQI